MSRRTALLVVVALLHAVPCVAQRHDRDERLLFTGDIMLARQVDVELQRRHVSPWAGFAKLFRDATLVGGNFEGALGSSSDCAVPEGAPCFATPIDAASRLKGAGFSVLTTENNHSGDLGAAGRARTHAELRKSGILGLDFAHSPQFVRVGDVDVAFIAITIVPAADGQVQQIPSTALEQKLRLARQLASVVVVSIHWGNELQDWASDAQHLQAEWLVDHGTDVVVGHHPHVVQPAGCIHGKPVFFSLGNHVFDQKYPETKEGRIADCRVHKGRLTCASIRTHTEPSTSIPVLVGAENDSTLARCVVATHPSLVVGGYMIRPEPWSAINDGAGVILDGSAPNRTSWQSRRQNVLSLQTGLVSAPGVPLLFSLERHPSTLDGEIGVRPYVYEIGAHGLVARWRGSALAWPLLDAKVASDGTLCALHRGDSFVTLDSSSTATKVARYRWNSFGFSAAPDDSTVCAGQFSDAAR